MISCVKHLEQYCIEFIIAEIHQVTQKYSVERFIQIIKVEEVYLSESENNQYACDQLDMFIEDIYNYKRIHSSLGYLTPVE